MVKAIIDLDPKANQILNIVKAKENLNDKNQALNLIITIYANEFLSSDFRPDFINKVLKSQNEKTIKIPNWDSHFK
jgi:hypothetical protein